jgi:hypothetical protein
MVYPSALIATVPVLYAANEPTDLADVSGGRAWASPGSKNPAAIAARMNTGTIPRNAG